MPEGQLRPTFPRSFFQGSADENCRTRLKALVLRLLPHHRRQPFDPKGPHGLLPVVRCRPQTHTYVVGFALQIVSTNLLPALAPTAEAGKVKLDCNFLFSESKFPEIPKCRDAKCFKIPWEIQGRALARRNQLYDRGSPQVGPFRTVLPGCLSSNKAVEPSPAEIGHSSRDLEGMPG